VCITSFISPYTQVWSLYAIRCCLYYWKYGIRQKEI
jgi:hypothetical protein